MTSKVLARTLALVVMSGLIWGSMPLSGQETKPAAPATEKPRPAVVPIRVTVVIGRYQGEKQTGNLPFVLAVNTGGRTSIQMGSSVPIPSEEAGKPFKYQHVGTNIHCGAGTYFGEGRYSLSLQITDNQLFLDAPGGIKGIPAFQNFTLSNDVTLRDGETAQLGTAVDKASGEQIRVAVTLNVIK